MLVPLSWLKQYVDVAIPTAELAERLSLAGLEVEAIETVGDDEVLNIAITPDAARCLSVIGVAREVAAITKGAIKLPADEAAAAGSDRAGADQADGYASVRIEDAGKCARYIGMVISGVKVGASPQWMQDRLGKAGVRPVNNVVDVTNYVMLEWGQPLHAFDYAKLKSRAGDGKPSVSIREAASGEKMKTLDGGDRTLDDSMLVIADSAGPIAVAGVMGGADSEVSSGTTEIFLESACFDRTTVRRGAQKLKMATEASYRFTRGVPAELAAVAARRAAKLLVEVAGGRIVPGVIDAYPTPQEKLEVYLTASQVRRTLGVKISIEQIAEILRRLEFQVEHLSSASPIPRESEGAMALFVEPGETVLKCAVPWFRLDVRIPADLTEEVARMIGFDSIATTQMSEPLPHPTANLINEAEEKIRDVLVGCGLQETINYTLTTPQKHDLLGLSDGEQTKYVTLANPMSVDRTVMRRSMIVSAVENLAYNARFAARIATFEVGRVYLPELSEDGVRPLEDRRVSILLSGPRRETNINADAGGGEAFDFFDLKGIVEAMLDRLGVSVKKIQYLPHRQPQTFTPRCAQVVVGDQVVGTFGELNPAVLGKFDVKANRVAVAELKIGPLLRGDWDWSRVTTVNSMPMVIEDLAFVVADAVGAGRVQETIRRTGSGKVVGIELFDIFRGEVLGAGKKSLAFRVSYQVPNAAMTNEQVVALRNEIVQAVSLEHGGVLRAT